MNELKIIEVESTLVVEVVEDEGVLGCVVDPGSTGICL